METTLFQPIVNQVYKFNHHTVIILEKGKGLFEVDFKNYRFGSGKAIFLSPGQYFKLISGSFSIKKYTLEGTKIDQIINSRYLFKHLVSLGHIDLSTESALNYMQVNNQAPELICKAIENWVALNPFNASTSQVNLLFNLKEIIDERYKERISVSELAYLLGETPHQINLTTKVKLKQTVNKLTLQKVLLEAQRKVVFTNLTTKEIAYDLGFTDPTYFNRFFKLQTTKTPQTFRNDYEVDDRDSFIADLLELIDSNYKQNHSSSFYAEQLAMTPKSLSKKLHQRLGKTPHQLIKEKILAEAETLLQTELPVTEVAYELGFKEPNHFTAFFKTYKGNTPSHYKSQL